jgi:SH3-like domain-containing protein
MDAQLYPMPSFQARPTTNRVRTGEAVQVLTQQDQWMYVETTAGERGWVHRGWFQE